MHAVFRETTFAADVDVSTSNEFQEFQRAHANLPGYRGTVVVAVGNGRHLTVTVWDSERDMHAAREAIGSVVERFIAPIMTAPAILLGTGLVKVNDMIGESTPSNIRH
jgi:hypothetical protein